MNAKRGRIIAACVSIAAVVILALVWWFSPSVVAERQTRAFFLEFDRVNKDVNSMMTEFDAHMEAVGASPPSPGSSIDAMSTTLKIGFDSYLLSEMKVPDDVVDIRTLIYQSYDCYEEAYNHLSIWFKNGGDSEYRMYQAMRERGKGYMDQATKLVEARKSR